MLFDVKNCNKDTKRNEEELPLQMTIRETKSTQQ